MPHTRPQLDYAERPSWRRRGVPRWAVIAIVLAVLLPPAIKFGSRGIYAMRISRLFERCVAAAPPAIAYSENPTEAQSVRALGGYEVRVPNGERYAYLLPPAWADVLAAVNVNVSSRGTVYLGQRRSASSTMLVGVDVVEIQRSGALRVSLATRTLDPGTTLSLPRLDTTTIRWLTLSRTVGELRILGGQPDPNDSAHFTIRFTVNGAPGLIDGWLNDDGTTLLEVRDAATTLPTTAPATAP